MLRTTGIRNRTLWMYAGIYAACSVPFFARGEFGPGAVFAFLACVAAALTLSPSLLRAALITTCMSLFIAGLIPLVAFLAGGL